MQVSGMSTLDHYLSDRNITNASFGRILGVSEATVSRLRRGKQAPSMALVARIKSATDGLVTADSFMPPTMPLPAASENSNQPEVLG